MNLASPGARAIPPRDATTVPPQVSVCILAGGGEGLLDACLASLRAQRDAPPFELILASPSDRVDTIVTRHFPDAQIRRQGPGTPGAERNALIRTARGDVLLFLDDDVTVAPSLLRNLVTVAAEQPASTVFGGPNVTPPGSSRFELVQGAVLSSLVGAGPVARRYGARHPGPADERWFTLCNLAVRREAMRPFPAELRCAEENAVLAELSANGEPMAYDPRLAVAHRRRPTWSSFAAQMFKYGRGRGQLIRRRPRESRGAFLVPSALLLYAVIALAAVAAGADVAVLMAPIAVYALLLTAAALRVAVTLRSAPAAPVAAALMLTVHGFYGAGVIVGIVAD